MCFAEIHGELSTFANADFRELSIVEVFGEASNVRIAFHGFRRANRQRMWFTGPPLIVENEGFCPLHRDDPGPFPFAYTSRGILYYISFLFYHTNWQPRYTALHLFLYYHTNWQPRCSAQHFIHILSHKLITSAYCTTFHFNITTQIGNLDIVHYIMFLR